MKPRMLLAALVAFVSVAVVAVVGTAGAEEAELGGPPTYEVWLIDQGDKSQATGLGVLHVFDGRELTRDASTAVPESIDLGGAVASLCREKTGSSPVRPHMLVFNGGDADGPGGNSHAMIAYVASGHIAFLDAESREPIDCIDVGTQAHAAWPTPDQKHLIVTATSNLYDPTFTYKLG